MQKIKVFFKNYTGEIYVIISLTVTCLAFLYMMLNPPKPDTSEIKLIKTVAIDVEFHPSGYVSVAQIDPEWVIKTDSGFTFKTRYPIHVGDTIIIKKINHGR